MLAAFLRAPFICQRCRARLSGVPRLSSVLPRFLSTTVPRFQQTTKAVPTEPPESDSSAASLVLEVLKTYSPPRAPLAEPGQSEHNGDDGETESASAWWSCGLRPQVVGAMLKAYPGVKDCENIQRRLLVMLTDGYSVFCRGRPGIGKSFATTTWLLGLPRAKQVNGKDLTTTALVIVPTGNLVRQCVTQIRTLIDATGSVAIRRQPDAFVQGVWRASVDEEVQQLQRLAVNPRPHILVGTPPRLLDLLDSSNHSLLDYLSLKALVIDEPDHAMLPYVRRELSEEKLKAHGQREPLLILLDYIFQARKAQALLQGIKPTQPQTVFLSHTLPGNVLRPLVNTYHPSWLDGQNRPGFSPLKRSPAARVKILSEDKRIPLDLRHCIVTYDPETGCLDDADPAALASLLSKEQEKATVAAGEEPESMVNEEQSENGAVAASKDLEGKANEEQVEKGTATAGKDLEGKASEDLEGKANEEQVEKGTATASKDSGGIASEELGKGTVKDSKDPEGTSEEQETMETQTAGSRAGKEQEATATEQVEDTTVQNKANEAVTNADVRKETAAKLEGTAVHGTQDELAIGPEQHGKATVDAPVEPAIDTEQQDATTEVQGVATQTAGSWPTTYASQREYVKFDIEPIPIAAAASAITALLDVDSYPPQVLVCHSPNMSVKSLMGAINLYGFTALPLDYESFHSHTLPVDGPPTIWLTDAYECRGMHLPGVHHAYIIHHKDTANYMNIFGRVGTGGKVVSVFLPSQTAAIKDAVASAHKSLASLHMPALALTKNNVPTAAPSTSIPEFPRPEELNLETPDDTSETPEDQNYAPGAPKATPKSSVAAMVESAWGQLAAYLKKQQTKVEEQRKQHYMEMKARRVARSREIEGKHPVITSDGGLEPPYPQDGLVRRVQIQHDERPGQLHRLLTYVPRKDRLQARYFFRPEQFRRSSPTTTIGGTLAPRKARPKSKGRRMREKRRWVRELDNADEALSGVSDVDSSRHFGGMMEAVQEIGGAMAIGRKEVQDIEGAMQAIGGRGEIQDDRTVEKAERREHRYNTYAYKSIMESDEVRQQRQIQELQRELMLSQSQLQQSQAQKEPQEKPQDNTSTGTTS